LIPAVLFYGIAMLCLCAAVARLALGPTSADRLIAADAIGVYLLSAMGLAALISGRSYLMDVAMAFALLSFADVMVISKFMEKGDITL